MKDSRLGESLWFIWDGVGYEPTLKDATLYYTEGVVDADNEVVCKALASSLQRDGISSSLGQGFLMINAGLFNVGYAGTIDGEIYQAACDQNGETNEGEILNNVVEVTWAEVASF